MTRDPWLLALAACLAPAATVRWFGRWYPDPRDW